MTGAHAEHCPPSFWLLPIPDSDASPADEHPAPAGLVLGSSRVTAAAPRRRRLGAAKRPPSPQSTRCWIACPAAARPCPAGGVCRPPRSVRRSETRSEGWETVIGGGDRRRRSEAETGGGVRMRSGEAPRGNRVRRAAPSDCGHRRRHAPGRSGASRVWRQPESALGPAGSRGAGARRAAPEPAPPRRTDSGEGSTGGRTGSQRLARARARVRVCGHWWPCCGSRRLKHVSTWDVTTRA